MRLPMLVHALPSAQVHDVESLNKRFSSDVLKIEIAGPEYGHLSIVDIPGLFHNATKYQSDEDRTIIRKILQQYIEDSRTIILAVMDARNNLANQEVFSMAREADPKGKRTLGIITKCDAVQSGDEATVLRIAQNEVEKLHHGWFVVRNRSSEEVNAGVTIEERHEKEKEFFRTAPWNVLPIERIGIGPLTDHLGKLLYSHIKGEYPALVGDIQQRIQETRAQLEAYGPPRLNTLQQRQYLSRLASRFQDIVTEYLRGNYKSSWNQGDPRKLRMLIHSENESFAQQLSRNGLFHSEHRAASGSRKGINI